MGYGLHPSPGCMVGPRNPVSARLHWMLVFFPLTQGVFESLFLVLSGLICIGRSYQSLIGPDNTTPGITNTHKPLHRDKVSIHVVGGQ